MATIQNSTSYAGVNIANSFIDEAKVNNVNGTIDDPGISNVNSILDCDGMDDQVTETTNVDCTDSVAMDGVEDGMEDSIDNVILPSENGKSNEAVNKLFADLFIKAEKMPANAFVENIRNNSSFTNPSSYESMIKKTGITENGTNFPSKVYNPDDFYTEDFYDHQSHADINYMYNESLKQHFQRRKDEVEKISEDSQ